MIKNLYTSVKQEISYPLVQLPIFGSDTIMNETAMVIHSVYTASAN